MPQSWIHHNTTHGKRPAAHIRLVPSRTTSTITRGSPGRYHDRTSEGLGSEKHRKAKRAQSTHAHARNIQRGRTTEIVTLKFTSSVGKDTEIISFAKCCDETPPSQTRRKQECHEDTLAAENRCQLRTPCAAGKAKDHPGANTAPIAQKC